MRKKYFKPKFQVVDLEAENDVIHTSCIQVCFTYGPHNTDDEDLLDIDLS